MRTVSANTISLGTESAEGSTQRAVRALHPGKAAKARPRPMRGGGGRGGGLCPSGEPFSLQIKSHLGLLAVTTREQAPARKDVRASPLSVPPAAAYEPPQHVLLIPAWPRLRGLTEGERP